MDETSAAEEQTTPPAQETVEDQAPEVDEPAPKKKRTQGRQKGYNTPKAEIERQEQIKEAMEYRLIGYTYRQIAEQMNVAPSTAYKWVAEGLAEITQETAEELRRVMFEQCHQIMQKLMPLVDETAPRDVIGSILKVQDRQMKLAGMLQGAGVSINIGKPARATAKRTSSCASRPTRRCSGQTNRCRRGQCCSAAVHCLRQASRDLCGPLILVATCLHFGDRRRPIAPRVARCRRDRLHLAAHPGNSPKCTSLRR